MAPTLSSALAQKVDQFIPWEILVVDNNSNDGTPGYCEDFLGKPNNGVFWKVIQEKEPGLSHARKAGILNAQYDYVIFCDDDNWLNADYVELAFTIMEMKPEVGILGGLGVPAFEGVKPDWFDKYSKSYAIGPQAQSTGYLPPHAIIYGASMVINKDVLIGLFSKGFTSLLSDRKGNDLVSGGDNEICLWYQHLGYKLYYDECLTFKHQIPANRLTKEYLLSRATGKGKTEAVFLIYKSMLQGENKVRWLSSRIYWYLELIKRIGWAIILIPVSLFSMDYQLAVMVLKSSIKFRIRNWSHLIRCQESLKNLISAGIQQNNLNQ